MSDIPQPLTFSLDKKAIVSTFFFIAFLIGCIFLFRSCGASHKTHKDTYIIGRDSSWHSLQVYGKEKNLVAFTNELMTAISQKTKLHFQWYESNAAALEDNLIEEYCDAILDVSIPTPYDKQTMIFSEVLLETGPVLAMSIKTNFKTPSDLDRKTIGVTWNTLLSYNNALQSFINKHHLLIMNFNSPTQAFDAMIRDQIDGVIIEAMRARSLEGGFYKGNVKIATLPLTEEGMRLIALKTHENEAFIEKINDAIDELKSSGAYETMLNKWGLVNVESLSLS